MAVERRHSAILYSFCSVRDTFAIKTIKNEINEDSELFKFFYLANATIIHNHPQLGKCFVSMIREIYKRKPTANNNNTEDAGKLAEELSNADDEAKTAALLFVHAYTKAFLTAAPFVIVDLFSRVVGKSTDILILSFLSKFSLPSENRNAARFGMAIAKAACL